ncbi:CHASE2 domain-containing protein [uncultured Dysgonomonas sp.]|uniref:CHASE2 domain-containing protein n=1 Tax=uncultured Dysgonomonas sp. TaxID=206096 RepID=A0A212K7N9_9BACT|nr:CHASE2 domain-containing protein [uncultured Dysgonomonas sp.]SBW07676.1 membrane hypothetical protein [uncultured Dysgonomonas sp.]
MIKKLLKTIYSFYKLRFIHTTIHAIVATALIYLLANFIFYIPLSLDYFAPIQKSNDFQLSDVFSAIRGKSKIINLNEEIVIVSTDDCVDRGEIAEVIAMVNSCNPKVIGLDIIFKEAIEMENDTKLIEAISDCSNIVLACQLKEYDKVNKRYEQKVNNFFSHYLSHLTEASININSSAEYHSIVRDFSTSIVYNEDTISTFSTVIANLYNNDLYNEFRKKEKETNLINFGADEFRRIKGSDVLENKDLLSGKVVIIGDVDSPGDQHNTPVNISMSGCIIHAHILSTILRNKHIDIVDEKVNVYIAVVVCFIFVFISQIVKKQWSNLSELIIRVIQFLLLAAFFVGGYYLFVNSNLYWSFAFLLIMLGLTTLVFDIYFGAVNAIEGRLNEKNKK